MQCLGRVYCRGAPASRIRCGWRRSTYSSGLQASRATKRGYHEFVKAFACDQTTANSRSWTKGGNGARASVRFQYLASISAAATVHLSQKRAKDDLDDDEELTLEQSLLDTSEEERLDQLYGINQDRSIFYRFFKRVKIAFIRYIYEPIATGVRFLQLVIIFVPVFATIPIIFIGSRDPDSDNERSGTLWWYRFFVRQMERAGPTFIKVAVLNLKDSLFSSLDSGLLPGPTFSPLKCAPICLNSIRMSKHTGCLLQNG
jgi:hypothetical protein